MKRAAEEQNDQRARPHPFLPLKEEYFPILIDEGRSCGFWPWLSKYSEIFGIKSLFQVFGHEIDEGLEFDQFIPILKSLFEEKAGKRKRLSQYNTFEDAVKLIRESNNIIVLTGAGVSVSCGIPDFRSKNGIYSRLAEFQLTDPQEMFDIHYFRDKPETFYSFAKEIYPSNFKPSVSHQFIRILEEKGKLLRNYTQNIDTLETVAGIKNIVNCHGNKIEAEIFAKTVPNCPKCGDKDGGIIKPDIVFFGEPLPNQFHDAFEQDRSKVDLLIVMGSSLKVAPVGTVKDRIPPGVPQILINMESLPHMELFDIHLIGYCDVITAALTDALGWTNTERKVIGEKSVPNGIEIPILYKPGPKAHHWLFEGAVTNPIDSDSPQSDSSDCGDSCDYDEPFSLNTLNEENGNQLNAPQYSLSENDSPVEQDSDNEILNSLATQEFGNSESVGEI